MITTIRLFEPSNRYQFDFKLCTYAKGWAQLDTSQDASYFGTWINPSERKIANYCEGDVTIQAADTDEELVSLVVDIKAWNDQNGHRFIGIDPGFGEDMQRQLVAAGLGAYLSGVTA